jgi:hypothetical protein
MNANDDIELHELETIERELSVDAPLEAEPPETTFVVAPGRGFLIP